MLDPRAALVRIFASLPLLLVLTGSIGHAASGVRVVTEEYPPYNYLEDGRPTGLATEVVQEVLRRVGVEAVIEVHHWDTSYEIALNEPNTLIYSIGRNEEREARFHWVGEITPPERIFFFALRARVERNQIRLRDFDDAKRYRIGTTKNDFREQFLLERGFVVGEQIVRGELVHNSMWNLFWGKVDLVPLPEMAGFTLARRMGFDPRELTLALEVDDIPVGANYMAFSLDTPTELVTAAGRALDAVRRDGTFDRIVSKYRKIMLTADDVKRIDK